MGTDNIDVFKKVIFSIPDFRKLIAGVIVSAVVYSIIGFLLLQAFYQQISWVLIPFVAFFVYILPAITSGEALYHVLEDYPRRWGYFLAMCNQAILFVFSLILSLSGSIVAMWNIIWLGLITVYLSNFFVLLLSVGYQRLRRVGLMSLLQPLLILGAFHIFLGRYLQIPVTLYLLNFGFLLVMGLLLLISFAIFDYLIGSNVANVSVLQLVSGLLQKRQEALDLGFPAEPDVQTLSIQNKTSDLTVSIPWIHPGPLEGFGGGKITKHIIDLINDGDSEGFFFHVPSTHQSDPADPRDTGKIVNAMKKPQNVDKASKMIKKSFGNSTFYGRAFGDKKIVYLEINNFDDYEIAIFRDMVDLEEVTVVDLHNDDFDEGDRANMYYGTSIAEKTRKKMEEFLEDLDSLEQHSYNAGLKTDIGDPSVMSIVEEVDGQRTVLYGIEGNGSSKNLRELRREFKTDFDEVLLFSTDTHSSIHEMATKEQVDKDRIREIVRQAVSNVSEASIGLAHGKADKMNLLREDYASMIFSINILVRLMPLTLAFFYILLVVWAL